MTRKKSSMTHPRSQRGSWAPRKGSRRPWAGSGRGRGPDCHYERRRERSPDHAALRSSPDRESYGWHGRRGIQRLTRLCSARMLPRYLRGWMGDVQSLATWTVTEKLLGSAASAPVVGPFCSSAEYRVGCCSTSTGPLSTRIQQGTSRRLKAPNRRIVASDWDGRAPDMAYLSSLARLTKPYRDGSGPLGRAQNRWGCRAQEPCPGQAPLRWRIQCIPLVGVS